MGSLVSHRRVKLTLVETHCGDTHIIIEHAGHPEVGFALQMCNLRIAPRGGLQIC